MSRSGCFYWLLSTGVGRIVGRSSISGSAENKGSRRSSEATSCAWSNSIYFRTQLLDLCTLSLDFVEMPRPTRLVQQAFKQSKSVSNSVPTSSPSSSSPSSSINSNPPPSLKQQKQNELYSHMLDKVQQRRAQRHTGKRLSLSFNFAAFTSNSIPLFT